jgi:capsular polysaccharide biosynthesis protein
MSEITEMREYFHALRKHVGSILFVTFLLTALGGLISSFLLTPVYQAKTDILVNGSQAKGPNDTAVLSQSEIESNLMLVDTYRVVIKSPLVMDTVVRRLGGSSDSEKLSKQVLVENVKNTQVISVLVSDPDPQRAAQIANAVATVFQEEITKLMKVENVYILAAAKETGNKMIWPKLWLNIPVSFFLGLTLSVGGVLLYTHFDTTLRTEQDIEKYLEVPVIGTVSIIERMKRQPKTKKKNQQVNPATEGVHAKI